MADKKRGRPKRSKKIKKQKLQKQETTAMLQHSQETEIIPPKPSLSSTVKSLFETANSSNPQLRILPAHESQSQPGAETNQPSDSSSKTSSDFEATASRLEDKYAPGGSTEQETSKPEPEVIPNVVTDATVEKFLRFFFQGMVRVHGEHWEMSELDYAVMVPVNTAMINEQVAKLKWFLNSQNKALIVWSLVMGALIMSRSKNGGKFLEWLMEKILSLGSKMGSPGSKESPESPAS
jgi:hypothetical protein